MGRSLQHKVNNYILLTQKLAIDGLNRATRQSLLRQRSAQGLDDVFGPTPLQRLRKAQEEVRQFKASMRSAKRWGDEDRLERMQFVLERLEGEEALAQAEFDADLDSLFGIEPEEPEEDCGEDGHDVSVDPPSLRNF